MSPYFSRTITYPFSFSSLAIFESNWYYNLVVTTTLMFCDIFITLPQEKSYIWSYHSRFNWTTLFYIITRYVPFIANIIYSLLPEFWAAPIQFECSFIESNESCGIPNIDKIEASMNLFATTFSILYVIPWFIVLGCTGILFVRRIIALYGGSRLLSWFLTGLLICELVSSLVLLFHFTFSDEVFLINVASTSAPFVPVSIYPSNVFNQNIPVFLPETYFALPDIIFQASLVVLIVIKVFLDGRLGVARSNLGSILVRDGLWSYFCNLCGLLIVVIQPKPLKGPFTLPNLLWSYASFSVTSSRLILNIRAVAARRRGTLHDSTNAWARYTFSQNLKSFFASADELATPYHYSEFEQDSDSGGDE